MLLKQLWTVVWSLDSLLFVEKKNKKSIAKRAEHTRNIAAHTSVKTYCGVQRLAWKWNWQWRGRGGKRNANTTHHTTLLAHTHTHMHVRLQRLALFLYVVCACMCVCETVRIRLLLFLLLFFLLWRSRNALSLYLLSHSGILGSCLCEGKSTLFFGGWSDMRKFFSNMQLASKRGLPLI